MTHEAPAPAPHAPAITLLASAASRDPREGSAAFAISALLHAVIIVGVIQVSNVAMRTVRTIDVFPVSLVEPGTLVLAAPVQPAAASRTANEPRVFRTPERVRPSVSRKTRLLGKPVPRARSNSLLGSAARPLRVERKLLPLPTNATQGVVAHAPALIAPVTSGQDGVNAAVAAGRSWTLEQIEAEPLFTPIDRQPRLLNEWEIQRLLEKSARRLLSRGLEGRVGLWILIDERGKGIRAELLMTSGRREFDEAALAAVGVMRFRPARWRGLNVPVWVQLPVRFDAL